MPILTAHLPAPLRVHTPIFYIALLAVGLGGIFSSPTTQAELSFELGAVSLYKDRGEDQDEKNRNIRPALQGAWQYQHGSGFFIGNWFSTGKFDRATLQLDTLAGYGFELGNDSSLELGYTHSIYPHAGSRNNNELFGSFIYRNLSLEVFRGLRSGVNQKDWYYNFDYIHPINTRWSFGLGAGYEHFDDSNEKGKIDYRAGVLYQLNDASNLSLYFAGATRKHAVDDGIRDNRVILGVDLSF